MAIKEHDWPEIIRGLHSFLAWAIYPALGDGGAHVIYGMQNNIALPPDNDYAIFTLQGITRTATAIEEFGAEDEEITIHGKAQAAIKVDLYCSAQNGDTNMTALQRARNLGLLWASPTGVGRMRQSGIIPLYADDPTDTSLPNSDSGNWLFRATTTLHAYINHSITVGQEGFATPPTIHLNRIVKADEAEGGDLNTSELDAAIKES